MVERVVCCLAGYLCGSFLTADAVARRARGRTVFELGSGNPGMANVGHVLGTRAAAVTLAGDLLKVLLPWAALFALWGGDLGQLVALYVGLGATLGHCFPAWHGFRGGEGVATTGATVFLARPVMGTIALVAGLAVVALPGRKLHAGAILIPAAFLVGQILIGAPTEALVLSAALLAIALVEHVGPRRLHPGD
ncbi:glycerol-3-phosphate acyltransferase [Hugonella massiliensis]|uniref:glycerol-3-phosphate acyltransferase n=1 Tax=Hugonella massiliensis TaxID=1720315 RepID=UPI00073F93BA|nr:glycerol-3-phosphate acyltransferase [Hugonella massiliensis]